MDGFTVLEHLRAGGVSTPVLILTARGDVDDGVRGLEGGADLLSSKPFQTPGAHRLPARHHAPKERPSR